MIAHGSVRRLLNGDPTISWLQPLPTEPPVSRRETLLSLSRGRRVIHLGFTDEHQMEAKLRDGRWLHAALADVSAQLVGLDLDAAGVEQARSEGYDAHVVDVQDRGAVEALALAPADVVIAGEIIEHVESPGLFLRAIKPLLKADGRVVVTTPNAYRLAGFLAPLLGEELIHPDHVGIHSIHTLRTLAERAGYHVDRLGYYQNTPTIDSSLAGVAARLVRSLQSGFLRYRPHWSDGIYAVYSLPPEQTARADLAARRSSRSQPRLRRRSCGLQRRRSGRPERDRRRWLPLPGPTRPRPLPPIASVELLDDREPEPAPDGTLAAVLVVEEESVERVREVVERRAPGRCPRRPGGAGSARTVTVPPRGVSRSAFSTRFDATWSSRSWSASTQDGLPLGRQGDAELRARRPRAARPPRVRPRRGRPARGCIENSRRFIRARSSRSRTSRSSRRDSTQDRLGGVLGARTRPRPAPRRTRGSRSAASSARGSPRAGSSARSRARPRAARPSR